MKDAQGYKIRQEKKQKIEEAAAKAGQPSKDTAMRVSAIISTKVSTCGTHKLLSIRL